MAPLSTRRPAHESIGLRIDRQYFFDVEHQLQSRYERLRLVQSGDQPHDRQPGFRFRSGSRINAVAPGAIETQALASVLTPEIKERMLARTPLKRLGKAEDIAGAVLFLAAPVSAWITGQVLFVNGGGKQTLD